MTSATDELRRLLDERGVEWEDHSGSIEQRTVYRTPNGWCYVSTANDKWLSYVEYHDMTPEQAIDATLGRGTCNETIINHHWRGCGSCGYIWEFMYGIGKCERPRYCPTCGRKVKED